MTNDTMSIEEYRNYLFTEKEEWNTVYNPKRCSIDALIKIEIKQRGNGPDKKVYTESTTEPGPYFDPKSLHLHIWKNSKLIKNFQCEQKPSVPFIEYTNVKTGLFCCICHIKNNNAPFRWKPVYDEYDENKEIFVNRNSYSNEDFIKTPKILRDIVPIIEKFEEPNSRVIINWNNLMYKVKYSLNSTKIIYPISIHKSLYLWPWEFTNYKLLKLKNPCYKASVIFIKRLSDSFGSNYSYIV